MIPLAIVLSVWAVWMVVAKLCWGSLKNMPADALMIDRSEWWR